MTIAGQTHLWSDYDCSGAEESGDITIVLAHVAGVPVDLPADCPELGSIATLE